MIFQLTYTAYTTEIRSSLCNNKTFLLFTYKAYQSIKASFFLPIGAVWTYDSTRKKSTDNNPPGSERGPSVVATWGKAIANEVDAMGFKWEWNGRSSKHIPFDWSGP
jgi:hypothetical protein